MLRRRIPVAVYVASKHASVAINAVDGVATLRASRPRVPLFVGVNTGEVQARVGKIMTRDASSFGFAWKISTSSVLPSLADLAFGICLDY